MNKPQVSNCKDKDVKEFRIMLKKRQNPLIIPFLEQFSDDRRRAIVWYWIVEKLKYFNPANLKLILSCCTGLKRTYVVEHFLILERVDLAEIFLEFGWIPNDKLIKKYEKLYEKTFKERKSKQRHESDSSNTDIEEERELYKKILKWLKPNKRL
jgi:hypothetical protein